MTGVQTCALPIFVQTCSKNRPDLRISLSYCAVGHCGSEIIVSSRHFLILSQATTTYRWVHTRNWASLFKQEPSPSPRFGHGSVSFEAEQVKVQVDWLLLPEALKALQSFCPQEQTAGGRFSSGGVRNLSSVRLRLFARYNESAACRRDTTGFGIFAFPIEHNGLLFF